MKPARRATAGRIFAVLAGLCLIVVAFHVLVEAAANPWARSLTGAPTLTGEWLGQVTTSSGRKLTVWLRIEHPLPTRCYNCPGIEGKARSCEAGKDQRVYSVWGNVENWRGSRFLLKTRDEPEHRQQLTLGYMNGEWHEDMLELTSELQVPGVPTTTRWERAADGRETTSVIGGDPDTHAPVIWRMHRGLEREFEARCARSAT